jgi:uncharacterized damage-inducible protein DinB
MKELLLEQAEANRWINRTWLDALSRLTLEELDRPQGGFFGSIFGTWNHLLLGDRIWLSRITERHFAFNKLSDRLCADIGPFRKEREATDAEIVERVAGETDFARDLHYVNTSGKAFHTPLAQVYQHLFAHQHHHRGQISQMCHERGIKIPDGGLIAYYRAGAPRAQS